ncbi:MAG: type II toxin-antitoxin system PemK/MazF family toxin [Candidatus Anammoxibacter sp.]
MPFPFVTPTGDTKQKARSALVISDHSIKRRFNDVILLGITSQNVTNIKETEFLIEDNSPGFNATGLVKTSVVRCEYIMTIPKEIISRKLGYLSNDLMSEVVKRLKLSIGLKEDNELNEQYSQK